MTSHRFRSRATARRRLMGSVASSAVNRSPVVWDPLTIPSSAQNCLGSFTTHILSLMEKSSLGIRGVKAYSNEPLLVSPMDRDVQTSHYGSSIPHSLVMALETVWNSPTRLLPHLVMTASGSYDTSSYPRPKSLSDMLRDVLSVDMRDPSSVRFTGHIKKVSPP